MEYPIRYQAHDKDDGQALKAVGGGSSSCVSYSNLLRFRVRGGDRPYGAPSEATER